MHRYFLDDIFQDNPEFKYQFQDLIIMNLQFVWYLYSYQPQFIGIAFGHWQQLFYAKTLNFLNLDTWSSHFNMYSIFSV